ncbi:uncharacterized protein LOC112873827 isoform X2 [Panicum hallii]|uniref:uncharacterized protein LOC112873827 isoform X2 n=1 Tax=Panicum hallii TaxID=206008 RepID=UPI000DF4F091|nr:uncharacterized protein LOC112873827 isoform X2 [Panicum hallii]
MPFIQVIRQIKAATATGDCCGGDAVGDSCGATRRAIPAAATRRAAAEASDATATAPRRSPFRLLSNAVVQIIRGTRSEKYTAKDWLCEVCGNFNKVNHFLIFYLPFFHCGMCKKMYNGIVYFNLVDVEVNGKSILPEVKHQRRRLECTSYAFAHAQELNDIVENIILDDGSPIDAVDPMILADTYNMMFGEKKTE